MYEVIDLMTGRTLTRGTKGECFAWVEAWGDSLVGVYTTLNAESYRQIIEEHDSYVELRNMALKIQHNGRTES